MRLLKLLALVALMVLAFALPALAQDAEEAVSTGDAISVTATVAFISGAIAFLIEWVRKRWSSLDGDLLRAVSFALGLGAVFAWDLRIAADYGFAGLPDLLDAVASAVVIAFGAGAIGTWKNSKRAEDPLSSLNAAPAPLEPGGH